MLKRLAILIVLVLFLANIYGCFLLLAGAAGGAGTATWLSGKLAQEVNRSFDDTIKAAESGLKSLKMEVEKKTVTDDVAQLISKYSDQRTVWVDVHRIEASRSRIELRVGVLSDQEAARKIMDKILRYCK